MLSDDLLQNALDEARRNGAEYAEARTEKAHRESIHVRNGTVERLGTDDDSGWGIHVLAGGGWGFGSSSAETRSAVRDTTARAVEIARTSGTRRKSKSDLSVMTTERGEYVTPHDRDPFAIPIEDRIGLMVETSNRISN